jgi:hypothetical protein
MLNLRCLLTDKFRGCVTFGYLVQKLFGHCDGEKLELNSNELRLYRCFSVFEASLYLDVPFKVWDSIVEVLNHRGELPNKEGSSTVV